MKEQTREEPEILAAAERQMHAWALVREREDRVDRDKVEGRSTRHALNFAAISREAGAAVADAVLFGSPVSTTRPPRPPIDLPGLQRAWQDSNLRPTV